MKVTFYGGIAVAAIAATQVKAFEAEDFESEELAQNAVGPLSTQIEPKADMHMQALSEDEADDSTNLATIEAHSEGELEAWSDASSESGSEGELEALSESESESGSDLDEDFDLAQLDADADAEAEGCPCMRARRNRRRGRRLAWRRRIAILRARRLARIRAL